MTYTFKQNLVAKNKHSIKCPYEMKPEYVTLHDTANQASAANEIAYMIRNDLEVSFHIAVDEKEAIQGLPLNRNSWSCGDKVSGNGNRKGISVEICRPTHEDRTLYNQAEENAVYVAARLLYKYGLGIERLKKHQDWSGKKCPNVILTENRWEGIKSRVEWALNEIKKGNIEASLDSGTTEVKKVNKTPQWKKNAKGWWYEYADGSYLTNKWLKIEGEWYYFGSDGYAYCNKWLKWEGAWYWFNKDCKMIKDCILLINGKYYAFDKDGKMKTDVEVSDNGDLIL